MTMAAARPAPARSWPKSRAVISRFSRPGHGRLDGGELAGQADGPADGGGIGGHVVAPDPQDAAAGRTRVATVRTKVVLPGPVGPQDGQHLAGRGGQIEAVEGGDRAEADGEGPGLEQGRRTA